MKRLTFLFLIMLVSGLCKLKGQQTAISGTVSNSVDGTPVIGVNIMVKGYNSGTISDSEGRFYMNIPQNEHILVVSFVGMKTAEIDIQGFRTRCSWYRRGCCYCNGYFQGKEILGVFEPGDQARADSQFPATRCFEDTSG